MRTSICERRKVPMRRRSEDLKVCREEKADANESTKEVMSVHEPRIMRQDGFIRQYLKHEGLEVLVPREALEMPPNSARHCRQQ